MACRDPVDGIGVVRDADAACSFQLVTKAYRPGAADRRGRHNSVKPLRQRLRPHHGGLPDRRAVGVIEGDEDLAAVAVEDREALARRARGADPGAERVQGRDAPARQPEAEGQPLRGRDPDPQAGERAGAEPDRDEVDGLPPTRRVGAALDLGQEPGGVQGPPALGEPKVCLGDDVSVTPGARRRVRRRGIEADDDQEIRPLAAYFTRNTEVPTFLPLTNQVTWWRPGVVEVILFT